MQAAAHVADRQQAVIDATNSVACIGLDPRPALLPEALKKSALAAHGDTAEAVATAFLAFNKGIIDVAADHCAAVKPQAACYEAYGVAGWRCLHDTVAYATAAGIPVIIDAKRGDIGSTAEHYRQAFLDQAPSLSGAPLRGMDGDWLTVNGYLGADGITPFACPIDSPSKGIFVLVKTSNPSSGDLQDHTLASGPTAAEHMAQLVHTWGDNRRGACGISDIGAVVGATWPAQAVALRKIMPNTLFLIPGYGAQGGSAADALAGQRADGSGVLINSSRGIIGAWQQNTKLEWKDAIKAAIVAMNADLNGARAK